MSEFRLPELGEGVNEGELVKWLVKPGDAVRDDQPICEIMTDKATIEIPSPFSGTVENLHAKEGEIVKVHQLMLTLQGGASSGATKSAPQSQKETPKTPTAATAPKTAAAPQVAQAPLSAQTSSDIKAGPSTRKLAREQGVHLAQVPASGPHGRVLREDVERFLMGGGRAKSFAAPKADEHTPIRGMRKKIAEKMRYSKDHAAHFTYVEEADATELVKLRNFAKKLGESKGIKVTYLPFILKAMVAALKKHPRINSIVNEETQELITRYVYNISISVQTDDGLTVPVVKNVEQKNIFQLAQEIAGLVDRARKKKLTLEDFQGSTITLTNAGSIGGLFATPIINHPEVAILGFNKIFRKPVVVQKNGREKIVVRDWTYFSISLDHRMIDGAEAAEFMKTFIEYIEQPQTLYMEAWLSE